MEDIGSSCYYEFNSSENDSCKNGINLRGREGSVNYCNVFNNKNAINGLAPLFPSYQKYNTDVFLTPMQMMVNPKEIMIDTLIRKSISKLSYYPWCSISLPSNSRRVFVYYSNGAGVSVETEDFLTTFGFEGRRKFLVRKAALQAMRQRFGWQSESGFVTSASSLYSMCPLAQKKPVNYRKFQCRASRVEGGGRNHLIVTNICKNPSPLRNEKTHEILESLTYDCDDYLDISSDDKVVIQTNDSSSTSMDLSYDNNSPPLPCTWEEIFREMGNFKPSTAGNPESLLTSSTSCYSASFGEEYFCSASHLFGVPHHESLKRSFVTSNQLENTPPKKRKSLVVIDDCLIPSSFAEDSLNFLASAALSSTLF